MGGFNIMEWIERLNQAIGYMEEHLTDEIDYEQLGRIACCSAYHFQRMFAYMAGIPLSEYIRRRRMSLAAVDLHGKEMKIIDVAGRYGYSSPTAFNRAFQSVHGIAPSAVKNEGVSVKSFPPITFKVTVKGVEEGTNQSIQELERRIVTEWLPTSGYEYGNAPDVEVYISPDPQNARYEVWIPVVKK